MSFMELMDKANYNFNLNGESNLGGIISDTLELTNNVDLSLEQMSDIIANIPTNPEVFGEDKEKYKKTLNEPRFLMALQNFEMRAKNLEQTMTNGKTR